MTRVLTDQHASHTAEETDDNDVEKPDSDPQYESEDLQSFIDVALEEMNRGNYDKAIGILNEAMRKYPDSRAAELKNLILKLKTNSPRQEQTQAAESADSTLRQRKQSHTENGSSKEFVSDHLEQVKKVNSCKNYYEVLGVARDATENQIKVSYKKLALQLHPDKNRAPGAAEAFKTLGNAVATLTDARKRKEYDLAGANYINGKAPPHITPTYHRSNFNFYSHHFDVHETMFQEDDEYTPDELFNMIFTRRSTQQNGSFYRQRPYQPANMRQPQEPGSQQPSMTFVLLLTMIVMSMLMSLFSSDPIYSLSHSSKFNVRRITERMSVPYYVGKNFEREYQGSLVRLEQSVEEDYIIFMKQHCQRERHYRDSMLARARSVGSRAQFAQAQGLKLPSCEKLAKMGFTRYTF